MENSFKEGCYFCGDEVYGIIPISENDNEEIINVPACEKHYEECGLKSGCACNH